VDKYTAANIGLMPSAIAAWLAVLLFTGAIAGALFFNGIRVGCFTASLVLLNLWLACVVWQNYQHGLHLPKTGLTLSLTLFWLWLGASLLWHPAPLIGINYFWIVGSLPLVFWIYTLSQDQNRLWRFLSGAALLAGVVLAVWALYQVFVQHDAPRSAFLDINSHAAFLNLIALPAAAYFLLQQPDARSRKILGALLFLLFFAIALTKGRAAMLSFALGMGLLIWMAWGHAPRRNLWALLALVTGAYLLANVTWQGGVGERLLTVFNPASAGADRFIIWQQAWEMMKSAPWLGTGIGTFWLAWPPWRAPEDNSGGYYVHNDYLQIWIEAGLPALLLLFAVLAAALWLLVRALKDARTIPATRIEITGLFAGLLAIAAHSFLNFNLYVLPTLILAGIVLGRFQQLVTQTQSAPAIRFYPATWLGKPAWRALVVLCALFPLGYFASQGLSDYYYQQALRQSLAGKQEAASDSLRTASRLSPLADNVLNTYADLFRHLLAALPADAHEDRKVLYTAAYELLDRAQQLNTLRAQIFLTRGQLYQQNPLLTGEEWFEQASAEYQTAIRLDPRLYQARVAYAQLLLSQGQTAEARHVLEAGMPYYYFGVPDILQYYELTRWMREQTGNTAGAAEIAARVEGILKTHHMKRIEVPNVTTPQAPVQSGMNLN
jgi:O-antigen ligase